MTLIHRLISVISLSKPRYVPVLMSCSRSLSSKSQFFSVDYNSTKNVATFQMNHAPVNSFTLPFLTDFLIQWDRLENDKDVRAVILTSGVKRIFSAGVDMAEFSNPEKERLREFYRNFQELWFKIYGSNKITIAAVTGQAVAAGSVLAMCCDYRISIPMKKSFGISSGRIGLLTPPWFIKTLVHNIGDRKAELMLQSARHFSSAEALEMGIIDEIADTPEMVLARANEVANEWMASPSHSHEIVKMSFRKKALDKIQAIREEEGDTFCNHVLRDSIQKTILKFVESSKKRSANKETQK